MVLRHSEEHARVAIFALLFWNGMRLALGAEHRIAHMLRCLIAGLDLMLQRSGDSLSANACANQSHFSRVITGITQRQRRPVTRVFEAPGACSHQCMSESFSIYGTLAGRTALREGALIAKKPPDPKGLPEPA